MERGRKRKERVGENDEGGGEGRGERGREGMGGGERKVIKIAANPLL